MLEAFRDLRDKDNSSSSGSQRGSGSSGSKKMGFGFGAKPKPKTTLEQVSVQMSSVAERARGTANAARAGAGAAQSGGANQGLAAATLASTLPASDSCCPNLSFEVRPLPSEPLVCAHARCYVRLLALFVVARPCLLTGAVSSRDLRIGL